MGGGGEPEGRDRRPDGVSSLFWLASSYSSTTTSIIILVDLQRKKSTCSYVLLLVAN